MKETFTEMITMELLFPQMDYVIAKKWQNHRNKVRVRKQTTKWNRRQWTWI